MKRNLILLLSILPIPAPGQLAFGVTRHDAQAVIDGAIKRRGVAQERGVLALDVAHLLHHVDARRRIEHAVENDRTFETQIQ